MCLISGNALDDFYDLLIEKKLIFSALFPSLINGFYCFRSEQNAVFTSQRH